ncbi:MAG: hypothetical protein R3C05_17280 [Pirellulaceae bacterium]
MQGFLLPQFELSSVASALTGNLQWDRTGEDVVADNVLAFDIRGYDPGVPNLLTVGPDLAPGVAGFDDSGSGTADDSLFEYDAAGSDDAIVTVNDLAIWQTIQAGSIFANIGVTPPSPLVFNPVVISRGEYVDLAFMFQGGGPMQNPDYRGGRHRRFRRFEILAQVFQCYRCYRHRSPHLASSSKPNCSCCGFLDPSA